VHTIHIGIGGNDYLIVTEAVDAFFDVEGCLQKVELFVFVNDFLGQSKGVQGLTAKTEDGLCVHVAALGDGATGRVSLGDEDAALLTRISFVVVEVDAAIAQLAVVQVGFLGTFASQFGHTGNGLALLFRISYLLKHHLGHFGILVQIVIHLLLHEVAYVFVHTHPIGRHGGRTELHLRLAFKHRLFHIEGNGGYDTVSDVSVFVILVIKFLDGAGNVFFESTLVRSAQGCVLSVDEGVVLFAILIGVGKGYFDVFAMQMDNGVKFLRRHTVFEKVHQSVARNEATTIVDDGKPRIQIGVITEHGVHRLLTIAVVLEQSVVRLEEDVSTVFVGSVLSGVALQHSLFEYGRTNLSIAVATHFEVAAQGIYRLHTHTVQTHALLEGFAIVLSSRIQHTDGFNHLSLRDASSVVAHTDTEVLVDVYLDALAGVHLEFIDAVVDDLLQQDVDSVVAMASVAQLSDVHTRSGAYMIHVAQVADVVFVILHGGSFWVQIKVEFFHIFLYTFLIRSSTLVLGGIEVLPLRLHLVVRLQLGIALSILEAE